MIKVITERKDNIPETNNSVVAIGNFDGVHLGHQSLIKLIIDRARTTKKKSGIFTFEPHPREFFKTSKEPFKIMTKYARREKLNHLGLDFVIELPFDRNIAAMQPKEFIEEVLHKEFGIKHIIIGRDFRFGKGRIGDSDALKALASPLGITVEILNIRKKDGLDISSTNIRKLIQSGNIKRANSLLGSYHSVRGVVEKGDQRGRDLNFPTANIKFGECIIPSFGVYASRVRILDQTMENNHYGATSIGTRPTFGSNQPNLEVHLFEFNENIYGTSIEVELLCYMRPELSFENTNELIEQMEKDCFKIKKFLSSKGSHHL